MTRMTGLKYTCFAAALLAASTFVRDVDAQNVKVVALVDEATIGTEERLTYTVEVQGTSVPDLKTPEPPRTTGLSLMNSIPSTSRNISVVNGEMTMSLGYSWYFSPIAEGKAVVHPTTVDVGGRSYTTEEVSVTVVPQSQRPARRRSTNSVFDLLQPPADDSGERISERDIFIRALPSARHGYRNEQFVIEYGLYFRNGIQLRQSRLADSWDAEGFWREELEVESRPVPRTVVENGLRYNMIVLKRVAVFPTRSGTLKIDPLRIESEASAAFGSRDPFFALRNRYQPVELSSPPVRIESLDFPSDAPASFTGAVGTFDMNVSVDRSSIEVGESAQLRVTISGAGNIATLAGPTPDLPGIFESYDPHVETSVNRSSARVRGSKTFTYVLIPRSNGTFDIPPIEFAYLDPRTGDYEILRSDAHEIVVTGDIATLTPAIAMAAGLPVDDVPPILTSAERWRNRGAPVHTSVVIYVLLAAPLLAGVASFAYKRRAARLASDVEYARSHRANPIARRILREAETHRLGGDSTAYYAALETAVRGFAGDLLNFGEKALTIGAFCERLRNSGAHTGTVDTVNSLLEECEQARFSPSAPDQAAIDTAHERASRIIESLSRELSGRARE